MDDWIELVLGGIELFREGGCGGKGDEGMVYEGMVYEIDTC